MPSGGKPGLCETCLHCRTIEAARSTFYLCERALTDAAYTKYPRLPVLQCPGYERRPNDAPGASD